MFEELSEDLIINLAKNKDENAYAFLVRKYMQLVKKIVRKFFLVGAEMDDLIQEGIIGLSNAINNYNQKHDTSFKTYACICIKRNVLSAIKRYNNQKNKALSEYISLDSQGGFSLNPKALEDDEDIVIIIPSDELPADDKLIWEEKFSEIKDFIKNKLSKYEKKILSEFLNGKTYQEISLAVNRNTTSVENALSRIRSKLAYFKNVS